jgi:peptidoglycan/LPS O-acetylase OafA/YrhL
VTFFFILSGFVLCWSSDANRSIGDFYRRRVARIYPSYFVVATAFVAYDVFRSHRLPATVFPVGVLLQAWIPSDRYYFAVYAVLWTLSVEAFFYVLFPALLRLSTTISTMARRIGILAMVVLSLLVGILAYPEPPGSVKLWLAVIFPPLQLPLFLLGILLALELRGEDYLRVPLYVATLTFALFFVLLITVHVHSSQQSIMVVPYALLIVAAAHRDLTYRRSILSTRWMTALGVRSYAFYLVHGAVMVYFAVAANHLGVRLARYGVAGGLALLAGSLALGIAASAILFRFVERPLERRLRPAGRERASGCSADSTMNGITRATP